MRVSEIIFVVVLTLLFLFSEIFSSPSAGSHGVSSLMRRLLRKDGHEADKAGRVKAPKITTDLQLVTDALASLSPTDFVDDTVLVMVKGSNGSSIYKHIDGVKGSAVLFRRESDDSNTNIILLTRTQDHLRIGRTKRTYVVLKQNPEKKDHYFLFYAYITKDETKVKKVEFDSWDARGTRYEKTRAFGWTNCKESSIISCKGASSSPTKSNDTPEYTDEDDVLIPDDANESEESSEKQSDGGRVKRQAPAEEPTSMQVVDPLVKSAAKILERTFVDSKFDYYLDLRDDSSEAKLVGLVVNLVTKGATAVSVSHDTFDNAVAQPSDTSADHLKLKVIDALEASVKNFAGSVGVIGLLVGGVDNLDKKEGTTGFIGEHEAKLGKRFLEIILTKQSQSNNSSRANPSSLLEPSTVSKMYNSATRVKELGLEHHLVAAGRGALGGSGGLLGNLGVSGLLGGLLGGGKKSSKPTKKPETVAQKRKKIMEKLEGKDISQKSLASAVMKSSEKEMAKLKSESGIPDGYALEGTEDQKGTEDDGMNLKSMATGSLAMLENGDIVHKLPTGGFVLLPKEGGLIHLSAKEITALYAEPLKPVNKPKVEQKGVGLLGGVTGILSGLLNNVGTILKGGPIDPKTGKSKGIGVGIGNLLADLVNNANDVVNGDAGKGEDEETIDYQYEGDVPEKSSGRAFDGAASNGSAPPPPPTTPSPYPTVPTTAKPFRPEDCVTRRPGKKTWFDPLGLYPDPTDPCYFAPLAVPTYQWVAPPVPPYNQYGYNYPFYPYFGRRKKREISSETIPDIEVPAKSTQQDRKRRGWLTGDGTQNGNGCDGLFGIIGWVLGNRKKCGEEDVLQVTGQTGDTTFANLNGQAYSIRVPANQPQLPPGLGPLPPSYTAPAGYGVPLPPPPGYPAPPYGVPPPGYPGLRKKRDELDKNVPLPITRRDILAKLASQLMHQVASTAVGVEQPLPIILPGKAPVGGRTLISQGIDVLQFDGTGRSLNNQGNIKAGLSDQMDADLFSQIGWLTQNYPEHTLQNASPVRKQRVFFGFGLCPYIEKKIEDVQSIEAAIEFYLNIMLTGCDTGTFKSFQEIIADQCLQVISIKGRSALDLTPTCKYLQKSKLLKSEQEKLSKAFEISVFSQAYCAELDNTAEYDDAVSKTVRTLRDMFILAFKRAKKSAPIHFIKLTRTIIKTIKTGLTKALQDVMRYQACTDCNKTDQDGAHADLRALLEIIEFLATDADPWDVTWKTFHDFSAKREAKINKKLKAYFI